MATNNLISVSISAVHYHAPISLDFFNQIEECILDVYVAPDQEMFTGEETITNKVISGIYHAAWSKHRHYRPFSGNNRPSWILLADADIAFNPRDSERLVNIMSKVKCERILFGLSGRRIIFQNPGEFLHTPAVRVKKYFEPLGYFQLFASHNREALPGNSECADWEIIHDDSMVAASFDPSQIQSLPFACYHVGQTDRGWYPNLWVHSPDLHSHSKFKQSWPLSLRQVFLDKTVLVYKLNGGEDALKLSAIGKAKIVYVLDPWELNQTRIKEVDDIPIYLSGIAGWRPGKWEEYRQAKLRGEAKLPLSECVSDQFLEILSCDRQFTRDRFLRDTSNTNIFALGEDASDHSNIRLEVIWLSGEIGYGIILDHLPALLNQYRVHPTNALQRLVLAGSYYDCSQWPESVTCINLTIGVPDIVCWDGTWVKFIDSDNLLFELQRREAARGRFSHIHGFGVIVHHEDNLEESVNLAMLTISSIRNNWQGPASLLYLLEESPLLKIVCAKLDIVYTEMPKTGMHFLNTLKAKGTQNGSPHWLPIKSGLWLANGCELLEQDITTFNNQTQIKWVERPDRAVVMKSLGSFYKQLAPKTVFVRPDSTIVFCVETEDLNAFVDNWNFINWHTAELGSGPVCRPHRSGNFICFSHFPETLDSSFSKETSSHVENVGYGSLETNFGDANDESTWIAVVDFTLKSTQSSWIIFIDPIMVPSPAAELFLHQRLADSEVVCSKWGYLWIGDTEVEWMKNYFALSETDLDSGFRRGDIFRHLQFGPPAILISHQLLAITYNMWTKLPYSIPYEIYLTLFCLSNNLQIAKSCPYQFGWLQ